MYIDRLLDSSLPHNLIQEYTNLESGAVNIPYTISEESSAVNTPAAATPNNGTLHSNGYSSTSSLTDYYATNGNANGNPKAKLTRTPKNMYKVPEADENTPLIARDEAVSDDEDDEGSSHSKLLDWVPEEDEDTDSPIVKNRRTISLAGCFGDGAMRRSMHVHAGANGGVDLHRMRFLNTFRAHPNTQKCSKQYTRASRVALKQCQNRLPNAQPDSVVVKQMRQVEGRDCRRMLHWHPRLTSEEAMAMRFSVS